MCPEIYWRKYQKEINVNTIEIFDRSKKSFLIDPLAKSSILDVQLGSEYASVLHLPLIQIRTLIWNTETEAK